MKHWIAGVTAVALFLAPLGDAWACRFNGREIEELITNMYGYYNGTVPSDLRGVDRDEYALVAAENIACLEPGPFNEVLGHLAANYGTEPSERPAIEHIMRETHNIVLPALREYRDHSVFWTFVDDTFAVFTVVYVFRFSFTRGGGIFRSGGRGLQWVEKFREAARVAKMARGSRPWLRTLGAGLAVGAIDNLYHFLSTQKFDPGNILTQAQRGVVGRHRETMAATYAELAGITEAQVRANPQAVETRLTAYERTVLGAEQELDHIRDVAADLNGFAEPARMDIARSKRRLRELWDQTDAALLNAPEPAPREEYNGEVCEADPAPSEDAGACYPEEQLSCGGEDQSSSSDSSSEDDGGMCVAPELP